MQKILCDINIILDIFLQREPFFTDSYQVLKKIENNQQQGFLSGISIDTIFYILRRNNKTHEESREIIKNLLDLFTIAVIDDTVVESALNLNIKDLEDALQYTSGLNAGCTILLTRNKKDFPENGKLKVLTPKEYLKQISKK